MTRTLRTGSRWFRSAGHDAGGDAADSSVRQRDRLAGLVGEAADIDALLAEAARIDAHRATPMSDFELLDLALARMPSAAARTRGHRDR